MSEKTRTQVARAEMAARSLVFDVMLGIILLSSAFRRHRSGRGACQPTPAGRWHDRDRPHRISPR